MSELDSFLEEIEKQHKLVIGLDFDGVVHRSSKGFHDGTIYDEPVEGSIEAIKRLAKKYRLVIYTCKGRPERPLINGKTGSELIWEWLEKYGIADCIEEVTALKPRAKIYIDDKAIRFENWEQTEADVYENFNNRISA
jgi:FMN phosphatase YigB (HAD superfamily)